MTYTSTVTSKGQITIPAEVRKRLGLREGDHVAFEVGTESTTFGPADRAGNPFAPFRGALAGHLPASIGQLLKEERVRRGRTRR